MSDEYNDKVILSPSDQLYLQIVSDLNKPRADGLLVNLQTRLHEKQIECLNAIYRDKKSLVNVPCGRKFGKSEAAGYVLWRQALLVPGSACYYVAPEASHGKKIMWDTQRLQKFLGEDSAKYIDGKPNNVEMKITFRNGSFIKVIGSENWAAANGLTPHIVVYDEFKAFHPQFHTEMDPNRAAKNAPLFIIGTQPKVGDRNKEQYEGMLEYCKDNPSRAGLFEYTTFDNPINLIPDRKEMIMEQIRILRARGEEDVVQREYYSRIIPGGSRAVFPMITEEHKYDHMELMNEIYKDRKRMEWYLIADPGSTTCFAALFVAINPYTKQVYVLDELYEKDRMRTSTRSMYPRMEVKAYELYPGSDIHEDWFKVADEAAAWFVNEAMAQYNSFFQATDKAHNKKEAGLSLIKDQLIHHMVKFSSRCKHIFKEMQEYATDSNGNIPKRNDHLVDCLRYLNAASHYNMLEVLDVIRARNDRDAAREGRHRGLDSLDNEQSQDWVEDIFRDIE